MEKYNTNLQIYANTTNNFMRIIRIIRIRGIRILIRGIRIIFNNLYPHFFLNR